MSPRVARRFLLVGLLLAIGAAVAVAVMATRPVSAAPPPAPKPVAGQQTIYSQTFLPYKRFSDDESLQQYRYESGPGNAPNRFRWYPPSDYNPGDPAYTGPDIGDDAFFNLPDLTIGATPMSAVSAQVCLRLVNSPDDGSSADILFGVQDGNQLETNTELQLTSTDEQQQCPTLTLSHPVALVNRPHLVVAVELKLTPDDGAFVDGVTYTLRPTQKGDVTPGS